jgi:hypothetical protein
MISVNNSSLQRVDNTSWLVLFWCILAIHFSSILYVRAQGAPIGVEAGIISDRFTADWSVQRQTEKRLSLLVGYGAWSVKDETLSQLTHTGGVPQAQFQYSTLSDYSRHTVTLDVMNGSVSSLVNQGTILRGGAEYAYVHRLALNTPVQLRIYAGAGIGADMALFQSITSYRFADPRGFTVDINSNEFSGYGAVALHAQAFAVYSFDEKSAITGGLSFPLVGYAIRTGYASFSPKGGSYATELDVLGAGDILTVNALQVPRCTVEYERALNSYLMISAVYRFGILRCIVPRPIGIVSHDAAIRLTFLF